MAYGTRSKLKNRFDAGNVDGYFPPALNREWALPLPLYSHHSA